MDSHGMQLSVSESAHSSPSNVLIPCRGSGFLSAVTQEKYPDFFAAAYATSAPVQADGDFW